MRVRKILILFLAILFFIASCESLSKSVHKTLISFSSLPNGSRVNPDEPIDEQVKKAKEQIVAVRVTLPKEELKLRTKSTQENIAQKEYSQEECNLKCKDECGKTANCKQSEGMIINNICSCKLSTLNIPTYNTLILIIIGSILILIVINLNKLLKFIENMKHLHKSAPKNYNKYLRLNKINLRTILILFVIIAGIYYLVSSTTLHTNTKSTTFLIEDKCEAKFDYDRTEKIVKRGDGSFNNPEYEERFDVLSNPRLKSESHSITSDSDCRVECGLQCQVISKKYQSHSFSRRAKEPEFIKFDTSYLGAPIYRCYQNECACNCVNI